MDIRLQVVHPQSVLRVDASGEIDYADAARLARVLEQRDAKERLPILLDGRGLSGALEMLDMVQLVEQLEASPLRLRSKLALVVRNDGQLVRAKFLETQAAERELPVRAFNDPDEALRWLASPA